MAHDKEVQQRLENILQGVFSGLPTPLNDIRHAPGSPGP